MKSYLAVILFAAVTAASLPLLLAQPRTAGGLPRGTILAWVPPPGSDAPPEGWLLCNRENHERHGWVPDLSGRFLQGARYPLGVADAEPPDVGQTGGRSTHEHPGSRVPRTYVSSRNAATSTLGTQLALASHVHDVRVASQPHLPPYVNVAFIIKE